MSPDGDIRQMELGEIPRKDEILIPEPELKDVQAMNRQQRRQWYRQQRKKGSK